MTYDYKKFNEKVDSIIEMLNGIKDPDQRFNEFFDMLNQIKERMKFGW